MSAMPPGGSRTSKCPNDFPLLWNYCYCSLKSPLSDEGVLQNGMLQKVPCLFSPLNMFNNVAKPSKTFANVPDISHLSLTLPTVFDTFFFFFTYFKFKCHLTESNFSKAITCYTNFCVNLYLVDTQREKGIHSGLPFSVVAFIFIVLGSILAFILICVVVCCICPCCILAQKRKRRGVVRSNPVGVITSQTFPRE